MNMERPRHQSYAEASSAQLLEQQRTYQHDLVSVLEQARDGSPALRHDQYSIAWICALPIELAAARAMLDEFHKPLVRHETDTNTYILGSIKQQHVVIACLPIAQYGTNNAATVMTNLRGTFPSIRLGLMVGIGGGVPSMTDIRLGDVVVGTRVMQYDLGKIVGEGEFQDTATPRILHHLLGTALSILRSNHALGPSRIPFILQEKLEKQSNFDHPSSPDHLFHAEYNHQDPKANCDKCKLSELVPRIKRKSDGPVIHYGGIGSSNQVMRSGKVRDKVARHLNVICFEMEAAGLMDIIPCLPIRGICDYSDSHKNKEWQSYAAAIAAAYAREFIEVFHTTQAPADITHEHNSDQHAPEDRAKRKDKLLKSLKFEQMDSRKFSVKDAYSTTCRWLLNHHDYQAWLDPGQLAQHHGFLWIRGKPGVGKSTLMKFAYFNMEDEAHSTTNLTASFFFNARGGHLERSIFGMYRSLLFQLLSGLPDLQKVFDNPKLISQEQDNCPTLHVIKNLFSSAVSHLGKHSFTCFVDALDECDEQQVMDMVQCFEDLAEQAVTNSISLRICFSSRHYPYVDIRHGIQLTLEDQQNHIRDLDNYVGGRLRIKDPAAAKQLRSRIIQKAAGIFLWAVLVVEILNKENRQGGLALRKRLEEIPSGLSELFKDVLNRDNENMEHLLLCILWIVLAPRPLSPEEYFHAIWSGLHHKDLADPKVPNITVSDACLGYVVSSSKGLAQVTKSNLPTVQFIHESVRDFLLKHRGLIEVWPNVGLDWESVGHDRLKECCNAYMNHTEVREYVNQFPPDSALRYTKTNSVTGISTKYPFLGYASQNILLHAEAAAVSIAQDEFLFNFPLSRWIKTIGTYTPGASLLYVLADRGFSELIRTWLKKDPFISIPGERYMYPLFAALVNGHKGAVTALLDPSSSYNGVDITEGLIFGQDIGVYENRTPLSWAAQGGLTRIVSLLLHKGDAVNELDKGGQTPLLLASLHGRTAAVKVLIDKGADMNICDELGRTPLLWASANGREAVVRILADKGADLNARDKSGRTSLLWASANGCEAVVRILADKGADLNARDKSSRTSLLWALINQHVAVARLLINKGADPNTPDKNGWTGIALAITSGYEAVGRLLIDMGSEINRRDKDGQTPLFWAATYGYEELARLLITKGAEINIRNKDGNTAITRAIKNGNEAVGRLLVDMGSEVNVQDTDGQTPLMWAAVHGYVELAKLLITKGAYINMRNKDGRIAITQALRHGHEALGRLLVDMGSEINVQDNDGQTPLMWAAVHGYEELARLLITKGALVNIRDKDNRTPLLWAASNGHAGVATILIGKGADVDICDNDGWKPITLALNNGHEAIGMLLVDLGADVNVYKNDWTPLLLASTCNYNAIVRLLINKGADIHICDNEGWTPLFWAAMKGHEAVLTVLIHEGADVNVRDKSGRTPLSWARTNNHIAVARFLIDMGAVL